MSGLEGQASVDLCGQPVLDGGVPGPDPLPHGSTQLTAVDVKVTDRLEVVRDAFRSLLLTGEGDGELIVYLIKFKSFLNQI